jgi:hypothetical protein
MRTSVMTASRDVTPPPRLFELLEQLAAVRGFQHFETVAAQSLRQQATHLGVVFGEQEPAGRGSRSARQVRDALRRGRRQRLHFHGILLGALGFACISGAAAAWRFA